MTATTDTSGNEVGGQITSSADTRKYSGNKPGLGRETYPRSALQTDGETAGDARYGGSGTKHNSTVSSSFPTRISSAVGGGSVEETSRLPLSSTNGA